MIAPLVILALVASCASGQDDPRTLAAQGKVDAAIRAWKARVSAEPKNPDHRLALVDYLAKQGRLNDALDECQTAIKAIPKHYDLLMRMAGLCQRKGEKLTNTPGGRGTGAMYFEDVVKLAAEAKALAPTKREPRADWIVFEKARALRQPRTLARNELSYVSSKATLAAQWTTWVRPLLKRLSSADEIPKSGSSMSPLMSPMIPRESTFARPRGSQLSTA